MVDLKNIVVGEKLYIGIPDTNAGFSDFSPIGKGIKNESSQKQRIKKKYTKQIELDNVPYSGFEIIGYICGDSRNDYDNVILQDQRGMKIKVDLSYFINMVRYCTIVDGTIINDCIWGNLNSKKILIPTNSALYKQVIENTERKSIRVNIKDLQFGDYCKLHDGREITYLGYYAVFEETWGVKSYIKKLNKKKKHVFIDNLTKKDYKRFNISDKIDVSSIVKRNTIKTDKTNLDYVNSLFKDNDINYSFVPKVSNYKEKYEITDTPITENNISYRNFIDKNGNIDVITKIRISGTWSSNAVYKYSFENTTESFMSSLVAKLDLKMLTYHIEYIDPEDKKTKTICIDKR